MADVRYSLHLCDFAEACGHANARHQWHDRDIEVFDAGVRWLKANDVPALSYYFDAYARGYVRALEALKTPPKTPLTCTVGRVTVLLSDGEASVTLKRTTRHTNN